ncbi:MAG: hypothetical protein ACJ77N_10970, partial [Chloroflexota bacterium]
RGTRVLQLLNELEAGHEPDPLPEPAESLPTPVPRLPHEGDVVEPVDGATPPVAEKPRRMPRRYRTPGGAGDPKRRSPVHRRTRRDR